jgi:hypothetical protein
MPSEPGEKSATTPAESARVSQPHDLRKTSSVTALLDPTTTLKETTR